MPAAEFGRRCRDDPVARCLARRRGRSGDATGAASVTAQAPSSPESQDNNLSTNNFAKSKRRRRPASQPTPPARAGRAARSPVIAAALPRARA